MTRLLFAFSSQLRAERTFFNKDGSIKLDLFDNGPSLSPKGVHVFLSFLREKFDKAVKGQLR